MGTRFTFTFYTTNATAATNAALACAERIADLERKMTDYDPESELMQLCQQPVGVPKHVTDDLFDVVKQAQHFAAVSDGAFDITIGPEIRLWRRARRTGVMPPPEARARARQSVGYKYLRLDPRAKTVTLLATNMQLDLGGIAKGYAADQALALLRRRGISRALVAASGDLAIGDPPPGQTGWRVGIGEIGTRDARMRMQLLLRNAAVSTSGDAEQFVEIDGARYSHILDPRTGVGLTNRIQVTLVSKRATTTDALATTVCVLGAERGLTLVDKMPETAALVVFQRGDNKSILTSKRFSRIPRAELN